MIVTLRLLQISVKSCSRPILAALAHHGQRTNFSYIQRAIIVRWREMPQVEIVHSLAQNLARAIKGRAIERRDSFGYSGRPSATCPSGRSAWTNMTPENL